MRGRALLLLPGAFLAGCVRAPEDLAGDLEALRARRGVPALAAAAVVGGRLAASGAAGTRCAGSREPIAVTVRDAFHVGSITKSITAVLAAALVEEGRLGWDTTLAEGFPGLSLHPDYRGVTLDQLLRHRGGLPEDLGAGGLWVELRKREGTPPAQRMLLARELLSGAPARKPGEFLYANAGYALVGAMAERAAGKPWEDLLRRRLFRPLGMRSAGFGAPPSVWGHEDALLGPKPVPPGPEADNPPAVAPAGAVHCSVEDLARYAAFHLAAARGRPALLRAESFVRLHRPLAAEDYAGGWTSAVRDWAGGRVLHHAGSNTLFFAVVWIAPERDFAAVAMANCGGDRGFQACDEAVGMLVKRYLE